MLDFDINCNKKLFDIDIENGDVKPCFDIKTAILMSIFCEKRADASQVKQIDIRRGHFSNQFNDDYEVGSFYWLYSEQQKVNEANKEDLQDTILEGLQWLIDDNYLIDIDCNIDIIENKYIVNITTTNIFNEEQNYTF